MSDRAVTQAATIRPPRRGKIWAQAVDGTARPYNISLMPFGGRAIVDANTVDHVFVTLHADGGDIYYYFDSATGSALDDTAKNTAGTAVSATTMSAVATYSAKLLSGTSIDLRIQRSLDTWIVLKTSTGTAILRMYASSSPEA